ncbi:hypothetical protein RHSIM_Rhsim01G0163500 [Rhododendron simsii]|uniref:Aminotransferase-like plant mobile domain-containing protein n=1 Tax=Rhododendron simsii TaxID=118357 RepID=A0A834HJE9_RHOSS|nr:hypothetical protein RHSIM_Rhsim01G0163500 [Rhododendron simsii]
MWNRGVRPSCKPQFEYSLQENGVVPRRFKRLLLAKGGGFCLGGQDSGRASLSLVLEVLPEEANLIPPYTVLHFRVERGDILSCFVNFEATSQSIRKNNNNIDLLVSRWSKDTHTFVFPWGDGGPTLQDSAVLMRLSTRRPVTFDPSNLSSTDLRTYPPGTVPPAGQAIEVNGKILDSNLHLVVSLARGDFVQLRPLFLSSLFHRLDQVHVDTKRSMGSYDMWSRVSSTKSSGKHIDDFGRFFPCPYAEPVDGALLTSFFSEDQRIVDFQTEGVSILASTLVVFAAACPCSLPTLCTERARSVLYCPDNVARQFGYEQGAPGPASPLKSYIEGIRRFTRAYVEELSACYEINCDISEEWQGDLLYG